MGEIDENIDEDFDEVKFGINNAHLHQMPQEFTYSPQKEKNFVKEKNLLDLNHVFSDGEEEKSFQTVNMIVSPRSSLNRTSLVNNKQTQNFDIGDFENLLA